MKRIHLLLIFLFIYSIVFSQAIIDNRFTYKDIPIADTRIRGLADDFTITTTDGITRNLYNTLDSGKTVFVDLFFTTCTYCQDYAPIIEEIYQNTGAGQENIEFWGISNNLFDTNYLIDQYKEDYNISNPCAGPWGGGTTAFSIVVNGQNFFGFPTYCVICPDKTMFFGLCYTPTVTCFDPYFAYCEAAIGINEKDPGSDFAEIISVFPNPASNEMTITVRVDNPTVVKIALSNLLGTEVYASSFDIFPGIQAYSFPVENLPDGVYFLRLTQNKQTIDSKKILISR